MAPGFAFHVILPTRIEPEHPSYVVGHLFGRRQNRRNFFAATLLMERKSIREIFEHRAFRRRDCEQLVTITPHASHFGVQSPLRNALHCL